MPKTPGSRSRDYDEEPSNNEKGPSAVNPFSPWQLLIEAKRAEHEISLRALATRAQVPAGTLFNWVRNKNGGPTRFIYKQDVNRRIAQTLHIPEEQLMEAYNVSMGYVSSFEPPRPEARQAPRPAPRVQKELPARKFPTNRLIAMLEASGKQSFTLAEIKQFAALVDPG